MQIETIIRKHKLYKILGDDFNESVDPKFKLLDTLYSLLSNLYKVENSICDEYFSKDTNNLIFTHYHAVNDIVIESDIWYQINIGDAKMFYELVELVKYIIIDIYNINIKYIFINYENKEK